MITPIISIVGRPTPIQDIHNIVKPLNDRKFEGDSRARQRLVCVSMLRQVDKTNCELWWDDRRLARHWLLDLNFKVLVLATANAQIIYVYHIGVEDSQPKTKAGM